MRRFMDQGLFAYSRHPNYFGEILAWSGIWLTAGFPTLWLQYPWIAASPGFTAVLLLFVSGKPSCSNDSPKLPAPLAQHAPVNELGAAHAYHLL